jgi:hypothetical protein
MQRMCSGAYARLHALVPASYAHPPTPIRGCAYRRSAGSAEDSLPALRYRILRGRPYAHTRRFPCKWGVHWCIRHMRPWCCRRALREVLSLGLSQGCLVGLRKGNVWERACEVDFLASSASQVDSQCVFARGRAGVNVPVLDHQRPVPAPVRGRLGHRWDIRLGDQANLDISGTAHGRRTRSARADGPPGCPGSSPETLRYRRSSRSQMTSPRSHEGRWEALAARRSPPRYRLISSTNPALRGGFVVDAARPAWENRGHAHRPSDSDARKGPQRLRNRSEAKE